MTRWCCLLLLALSLSLSTSARAAPRHDICADIGDSFAFGVSSYGSLREWAPAAKAQHGADFRFLYVYILAGGMENPEDFAEWYVKPFGEAAHDMGAVPVYTFYQLLHLGEDAGYTGSHEADIVAQTLADPQLMRTYFEHVVWLLEVATEIGEPGIVHVEPDSWGFMMWAMGVEGNDDATSIPVQVGSSGHPDLIGFEDHAGGLGRALLALRDQHAPEVRLGWHASNFRVGTQPEVVTGFYAGMGDWDVLFSEHPHLEADEATWWEPWDPERVDTNLGWLAAVTSGAGVPLILWQEPIGTCDWHLLGDPANLAMLQRFAEAGVGALLFEHLAYQGEEDPDDIRAEGALGTAPPPNHPAGGTAADMRARVAAYSDSPLTWPDGSLCASGIPTGGSGPGGSGGTGGTGGSAGTGGGAAAGGPSGDGDGDADGGCGCRLGGAPSPSGAWVLALVLGLLGRCRRTDRGPVEVD